jgi:hypothetical protein
LYMIESIYLNQVWSLVWSLVNILNILNKCADNM